MSMEKDLEKVLAKGIEKGMVEGVEKLLDKNLIEQVAQAAIISITPELIGIIKFSLESVFQTIIKCSMQPAVKEVRDIILKIIEAKGNRSELLELTNKIKAVEDISKLGFIMTKLLEEKQKLGLDVFNRYLKEYEDNKIEKKT